MRKRKQKKVTAHSQEVNKTTMERAKASRNKSVNQEEAVHNIPRILKCKQNSHNESIRVNDLTKAGTGDIVCDDVKLSTHPKSVKSLEHREQFDAIITPQKAKSLQTIRNASIMAPVDNTENNPFSIARKSYTENKNAKVEGKILQPNVNLTTYN